MAYDRFLITPINSGLENNKKPFLIPDDAFAQLNNAFIYRGSVRKRIGSELMNPLLDDNEAQLDSRLRIKIGTTDANGDISSAANPIPVGAKFKAGQMFSIGTDLFTVPTTGSPVAMLTNGAATVHTYDTTTGAYDIQGSTALTDCYFYPTEPVMGLLTYQSNTINYEPVYAFDTRFAYSYVVGSGWTRLGSSIWTGTHYDFFWGSNYRGATSNLTYLFVTNNVDHIRWTAGGAFTDMYPLVYTAVYLESALIVIPFKGRLLAFNTLETGGNRFPNRVRYTWGGDPVDATAWRQDTPGKGGFQDAPTKEAIVSVCTLKDRLIVFFEKSTWELVSTQNEVIPFVWKRINSEIGVESTKSTLLFDKSVLGFGNVGIHACNGVNVERIDEKIPDLITEVQNNNNGPKRVCAIRDFTLEVCYWSYPNFKRNSTYPTNVLVFNYETGSWALNDDTITAFGYYQHSNARTWASLHKPWSEENTPWVAGSEQARYRNIIAGNQHGYTFIMKKEPRNAPVLQISNISAAVAGVTTITCFDHNLFVDQFVLIENCLGLTDLNDNIYSIDSVDATAGTFTIYTGTTTGTYTGGGSLTRVDRIDIKSKEYNFYQKEGNTAFVPEVAFNVTRTTTGEATVDTFISTSEDSMLEEADASGTLMGTNILETRAYIGATLEETQRRLWHHIFTQVEGEYVQFRIYLSDEQLASKSISFTDLELNAFIIYAMRTGY